MPVVTARPSLDRLAHLRHDRRGLPVPYVNAWGTEDAEALAVRYDSNVRANAVFMDDAGQDVPDFTRQNMGRQRECVTRGLCQVCGKPVPWERRHLAVASLSVEAVNVNGRRVAAVTEPWLDPECAYLALNWCPALIRAKTAKGIQLVHVPDPSLVTVVLSVGYVDGPLKEQTLADPPVMWAKVALPNLDIRFHGSEA